MRILLLSGEHPRVPGRTGGIGSIVASAATVLTGAGHEVHVLVSAPGLETSDTTIGGSHLHVRGLAAPLRALRGSTPRLFANALSCRWHAGRLGRFDVVEAPEWQALAAGFVLGRTPLVISLQTPAAVVAAHDPRLAAPTCSADALERAVVRRASRVLSASSLLVTELRAAGWLPADLPVDVLRPPVDLATWADVAGPAGTDPVVLGIGRLEPRKGFSDLLAAVARIDVGAGARVELVGGDTHDRRGRSHAEHLAALARDLGVDLRLLGELPQALLPEVLATARTVVLPSTFDSFNMAGLEAMASGRAVVLSDRVGLAELDDGSGAITVVPAGAVDELARAVARQLDPTTAERTGAAARALAARYDGSTFATQRTTCYRAVTGGQP